MTGIRAQQESAPAADEFTLRDGRAVRIRPITDGDEPGITEMFGRCSDRSRYFRFHSQKPRLRAWEARWLASSGGGERVALVATANEDGVEHLVADARFDVIAPGEAEAAFLIRDDYHGAGLGAALLDRLMATAAARNVSRLRLEVLMENRAMLALAARAGAIPSGSDGRALVLHLDVTDRVVVSPI